MTAKVVNITLLSLSMLSTLTASSQGVEIKRPKFHNSIHTEHYLSPSEKVSDCLYYDDSEGYTDYTYDVLGRTTAIRKAGEVWKNHPCKISYSTNGSDEVKRYCLENIESQVITPLGFYAEGSLRVTATENEDGRKLSIYTDRDGKKILERRGSDNDTYFVYDNFDRLRVVLIPGYQTNPDLQQQAYLYQYDLVGNMISKTVPGCAPIRYWYDCHNRCIAEQDGELLKRGGLYRFKLYDWFEQQILYETGSGTPQYSGNISSVVWRNGKNGNRSYCFTYDTLNRLEKGEYTDVNSSATEVANYGESVTYDSNGNITGLVRHGRQIDHSFGVVDTLSISYSGNRIIGVEKGGEEIPTANSLGIRQGSLDFAYNTVGALTQDGTRGITDIEYDLNSNPIRIQFNNGSVTKYLYSVDGQKLRTIHLSAPPNINVEPGCKFDAIDDTYLQADTTAYFFGGTLIYCDGKFKRYLFDGGYIDARYRNVDEPENNPNLTETEDPEDIAPLSPNGANNSVIEPSTSDDSPNMLSGLDFRFYIKDYLGNNREVIGMDGKIKQRTDYYPFGTPIQDLGFGLANQPYAYNGKEFDTTHGLNTHDYGARQYNTALPRWDRIDPLCEKYYHISPYAYCFNNPVNAIDPNGKVVIFINGMHNGSQGANPTYWNGLDKRMMNFLNDQKSAYYDGASGGILNLLSSGLLINCLNSRSRYILGYLHGSSDAQSILNSLSEKETIKIVTHSMGASFGKGFIAGIQKYLELNNIDINSIIKLEIDLAPFQPYLQTANPKVDTYTLSHEGDIVAGTAEMNDATNKTSRRGKPKSLFEHSVDSFTKTDIELHIILKEKDK